MCFIFMIAFKVYDYRAYFDVCYGGTYPEKKMIKLEHPGIWNLWICVMQNIIWKNKDPDISVSLISNGPPNVDWL